MDTIIEAEKPSNIVVESNPKSRELAPVTLPTGLRGSRRIQMRSSVSSRGLLVARIADAHRAIGLGYESSQERAFALLALADNDTADIVEQPFTLRYDDETGRTRRYTFDYLITKRDGTRIVVEVKNATQAAKPHVIAKVRQAATRLVPSHADQVTVFTDRHFTRVEVENAEQIVNCQKEIDSDADEKISSTIRSLQGGIRISDLVSLTGLAERGFSAVLRAMYRKELSWPNDQLIGPKMVVGREVLL